MMMNTIWGIYLVILAYYFLGTIGIYLINRKKDYQVKRKAWIKHIVYFLITNIIFFSIAVDPIVFRILAILIIIAGSIELGNLFRQSGYMHRRFFLLSFCIFAVLSLGFYLFSQMDNRYILFAFLILSIFDGFSQVSGQLFGKRKLMPAISPNKTVEGLIGGTLFAVLSALVFRSIIGTEPLKAILLACVVALFAFVGDAAKSVYKRKYLVKDFSNLIPGHGGVLDRFDSLIAGGAGVALLTLIANF
ncbi:MAG: phosphatidate cytidylyltransferase [Bacteroidales bacterium]|nr:phosphatidate cytidylyltransferase [Bacteroidales bacterium]